MRPDPEHHHVHAAVGQSPFDLGAEYLFVERDEPLEVGGDHRDVVEPGVAHSGAIDIPVGAILNFADPDGIQLSIIWEQS